MSQISVSNLTFGYEGSFDNIFEQVTFLIDTDWKLGLIGRIGKGKTTFLNLLMSFLPYDGSIEFHRNEEPFKIIYALRNDDNKAVFVYTTFNEIIITASLTSMVPKLY